MKRRAVVVMDLSAEPLVEAEEHEDWRTMLGIRELATKIPMAPQELIMKSKNWA